MLHRHAGHTAGIRSPPFLSLGRRARSARRGSTRCAPSRPANCGATERRGTESDGRLEDQEGDHRAARLDRTSPAYGFGLDGDARRPGDGAGGQEAPATEEGRYMPGTLNSCLTLFCKYFVLLPFSGEPKSAFTGGGVAPPHLSETTQKTSDPDKTLWRTQPILYPVGEKADSPISPTTSSGTARKKQFHLAIIKHQKNPIKC